MPKRTPQAYLEAKARIKSGDLIFWEGKGLAARIVRWATKSRWSHVGIALWWGHNRLMVVDSFPFKGTRARPLSHMLEGAHWMPAAPQITEEMGFGEAIGALCGGNGWNREAHAFALDELDRPYSWVNLLKTWLGLALVKKQYHCAQYAAAVLEVAGHRLTQPPTPESIAKDVSNEALPLCVKNGPFGPAHPNPRKGGPCRS